MFFMLYSIKFNNHKLFAKTDKFIKFYDVLNASIDQCKAQFYSNKKN